MGDLLCLCGADGSVSTSGLTDTAPEFSSGQNMTPGSCLPARHCSAAAHHNNTINPPAADTNVHARYRDVHIPADVHSIPHPHIYEKGHARLWVIATIYTVIKGQARTKMN